MNPEQFLRSIYVGDRACKAINIQCWTKQVTVQVDVISRLKPGTETWNFYTDGDVKDGLLVFSGVRSISFEPPGFLPNDFINDISVKPSKSMRGVYIFELSIGSVDDSGRSTEIILQIEATKIHLSPPTNRKLKPLNGIVQPMKR